MEGIADALSARMLERSIRGTICHSVYLYTKSNNQYIKDYGESKKSSILNIGM